ncbi:MAG: alpha/beta hydrolase [Vicinamibacterales bacterium]
MLLLPLAGTEAAAQAVLDIKGYGDDVLKATYYSPGKPGPAVLLLHMCNSDRRAWAGLGAKLAARGIHALALDYRGYGESGGKRSEDPLEAQADRTALWPKDIDAAVGVLTEQAGVNREQIGVGGASCSVDQAIQLARRLPQVKTLVLLAGATDRDGEAFLDSNPWLPVFGAAAADDPGAVDEMQWLVGFSAFPGSRAVEYPRGGHGTDLFAAQADLEPAIVDWFDQHLAKQPVVRAAGAADSARGPSVATARTLQSPGGAAQLREQLRAAKARGDRLTLPPETVVNQRGYDLLQARDVKAAIETFLLNVEARPMSANALDSLSDAYEADGQTALAIEFAEKALAALPADPNKAEIYQNAVKTSAEAKLAKLRNAVKA